MIDFKKNFFYGLPHLATIIFCNYNLSIIRFCGSYPGPPLFVMSPHGQGQEISLKNNFKNNVTDMVKKLGQKEAQKIRSKIRSKN
jgi:hypothetical protein